MEYSIRQSRRKQLLYLAWAAFLLIAGIVVLVKAGSRNPVELAAGITAAVLGAVFLMIAITGLVRPRQILKVSEQGLIDTSSARDGLGLIRWEEISRTGLAEGRTKRNKLLFAELKDTDGFIERLPAHQAAYVRKNIELGNPPVLIPLKETDQDPETLVFGIGKILEASRRQHSRNAKRKKRS
ncbi:MAG: STM3941 family protein [Propionicimonas sp.]|uniref:STM3941 family protein n=1 Tax=Propionicimonas sp. TaxID=1955623 RepID=UPI002B21DD02|nr:STM3941 family protein [Propionicimonas sp.]MEA4945460.1 STM3941 family protein [Propionicimonas sp.]MEA5053040.1 STM3941 family protein [Propionicimonas sp.]MEA5117431.1 STM3941 family protein [Propionicimonas sp.]